MQKNSRYVILRHATPEGVHFDFMLESEGILSTWRIDIGPEDMKTTAAKAEKIFDHDLKFLTYEGPVNKGTGRVTAVDKGVYSVIARTADEMQIQIEAEILGGVYTLTREKESTWQFAPRQQPTPEH